MWTALWLGIGVATLCKLLRRTLASACKRYYDLEI
jgi:hypothetical protein